MAVAFTPIKKNGLLDGALVNGYISVRKLTYPLHAKQSAKVIEAFSNFCDWPVAAFSSK